jgi:signal transduction histidine kinase
MPPIPAGSMPPALTMPRKNTRTPRELHAANAALQQQVIELRRTEATLRAAQAEMARTNARLEQRLQERTAAHAALAAEMESFAYTVSHDLRAPLRTITGFVEALREDHAASLSPEAQDLITRIVRGGTRMDRLITDLVTFSRVNTSALEVRPVALADCLRQLVEQHPEFQAPKADIRISGPLPAVIAAEPLLPQALAQLLGNAVKFMPPGRQPEITVQAEQRGEFVRLWICDNGIGVRPEMQPRLFRLFERLDAGRNYEGTGLGLAMVRRALGRVDGTVGLESDGKTGCRVWIQLKAAAAA